MARVSAGRGDRDAGLPLRARDARRRAAEPHRTVVADRDPDRAAHEPRGVQAAVAADRARPIVLRDRRRHHVQLRAVLRHGAPLPVDRRRVLPVGLPVSVPGHPAVDPSSQPGTRPRQCDRFADRRHRRRRAVVGLPDRAVHARHVPHDRAEAGVDRLPVDGPDARHRRDPAGGRTGPEEPGVLPAARGGHRAVHHRRLVRLGRSPRRLRQPDRLPGRRLGGVLSADRRRGAAPRRPLVLRALVRGTDASVPDPARGARGRVAHRPAHRRDHREPVLDRHAARPTRWW